MRLANAKMEHYATTATVRAAAAPAGPGSDVRIPARRDSTGRSVPPSARASMVGSAIT